ncbi:phosphatase PAP2 family protein [Hymenobacter sp. HMF4947]|uniref:Phosphatase PAP2 family protein n=1 Tax=Hymenobacter ginkgonis TaxID=2682976 RepID=A0A7K1TJG7_9BACT|nr:phosphatase PAP2 family protein [Hymenobacter ginkgonis]MVN78476.1 phosphatase PAP2 family protein [Hymenobacter ginkgonis]
MLQLLRQTRTFLVPYAVLLLAVGGVLLLTPKHAAFFWVNGHHAPFFDYFFRAFTNVGDGLFYVLVVLALLFVRFRWALLAFACFALTSLVAQIGKHLIFTGHPRPFRYFSENPGFPPLHVIEGVVMGTLKSFPSGHSTSAFSVFLVLTLLANNKKWGYAYLLLAAGAAYSRVYLAQHFMEDVYAGSLLGTALTLLIINCLNPYLDHHPRPWHQWRLRRPGQARRQGQAGPTPLAGAKG